MLMNTYINNHSIFGKTLFAEYGKIKLGIPLNFGIRIAYLSYNDSGNLFFEQPESMTELSTPEGWRVRGGHRLWLAPEGEDVYYPDNEPVTYEISNDSVLIHQKTDLWLNVDKSLEIKFINDSAVEIIHRVKNLSDTARKCSLWAISSMAPGGVEYIPLHHRDGGFDPLHCITMWDYTSLGDKRACYKRDSITLTHTPTGEKYKIGVGHPAGDISYKNKGVLFKKSFNIYPQKEYPDGNVSFETFMCDHMVEIESLSPYVLLKKGEEADYKEVWKLENI
ncbi:MAG: hypothetical protein IKJ68_07265 [Clostridia bacterium]|nr:hypothetical protein [Clostridia bacterium]